MTPLSETAPSFKDSRAPSSWFFKKKKFEGLSEEEIRGLIGELLFIKKFSLNEDFKENILRWKGCENGLHDFDFKEKKAEIKTFAQNGIIRISLIDQLDIQKNKNIYLICFGLSKKDGQFSLNDLINEMIDFEETQKN